MKRFLACMVLGSMVSACGGGLFAKYYSGPDDLRTSSRYYDSSYVVPNDDVPVYSSSDIQGDTLKLLTQGYVPVGQSSFYAPDDGEQNVGQIKKLAKNIGAHAALYQTSYRDTVSGAVPLVIPTSTVSYTNATANAYGPGGYATANGSATTNTYGTETVMMPYSTSRSNYLAVFFEKVRSRLGLIVTPLSDTERQTLGTNRASKIFVVVEGTSAFNADVLPGDFLRSINDQVIINQQTLGAALDKFEGQDVTLALIRDGKDLTKKAHVDSIPVVVPAASTKH